jgi:WD40 repeat protein
VLSSVATAPDGGGRLTVGASADRVAVWDADGALLRTFPAPHRKALTRVAAHGGTVVTAGDDGTVHRCDLRGRDSRLLIRHGEQPVTSLRVLDGPGGPRVLTTGLDGSVVVAPLDGHGVGAATTLVDVGLQVKGGDLEDAGRLVLCTNLGTARIRL